MVKSLENMILNQRSITKAILVGDIHYGIRSNAASWLHNIDSIFFHQFLIPYLKSLPDINNYQIFFTGDLFDSKQLFSVIVQNRVRFTIKKIAKMMPVHINIGNHDLYGSKPIDVDGESVWINSCGFLSEIPNVHIYDEPTTLHTVLGNKFTVIPFIGTPDKHNISKEAEILNGIKKEHEDFLFMHTTIAGFYYEGKPILENEGISIDSLAQFKKVFNGHIHSMQEKSNILILGTPYHTKSSEAGNPCQIYDVDFSLQSHKTVAIENKLSPQYKNISLFNLLDMTVSDSITYVTNSYVKVRVPNHLVREFDYNKILDILSKFAKTIEFDPVVVAKQTDTSGLSGEHGIIEMEKVDVKSKYSSYIDQLSMITLSSKDSMEIHDSLKPRLIESFDKLYKKAEEKIGVNDLD